MNLKTCISSTMIGIALSTGSFGLTGSSSAAPSLKDSSTVTVDLGPSRERDSTPSGSSADISEVTAEPYEKVEQAPDLPDSGRVSSPDGSKQGRASYTNCAGSVCITLFVSGNTVYYWRTAAASSQYKCTRAYYFLNGRRIATSRQVCGRRFLSAARANISARGNTFCNDWSNISGIPCIRFR
jgi:hypothetical protein